MAYYLSPLFIVLLSAFIVESNFVANYIEYAAEEVKTEVNKQMKAAAEKAIKTSHDVTDEIARLISESESYLDEGVKNEVMNLNGKCATQVSAAQNASKASLWKCLQMVRVVTDGTDIASQGLLIASDILGAADNFLQSLTACIIGPSQSPSQLAACYLSALGTIASGIAYNIEEVEHYITIVKRDVSDIHAAVAQCREQSMLSAINNVHKMCPINS